MSEAHRPIPLLRTPLHKFHVERGARLVAFAGYEMPVQYPTGILTEHLHTRAAAGLFDVSHMGQIAVRPISGQLEDATHALERLLPIDIIGLAQGRQRYALLTNEAGGILDDLMVANRGDHLLLHRLAGDHRRRSGVDRLAAGEGADALRDRAGVAGAHHPSISCLVRPSV